MGHTGCPDRKEFTIRGKRAAEILARHEEYDRLVADAFPQRVGCGMTSGREDHDVVEHLLEDNWWWDRLDGWITPEDIEHRRLGVRVNVPRYGVVPFWGGLKRFRPESGEFGEVWR